MNKILLFLLAIILLCIFVTFCSKSPIKSIEAKVINIDPEKAYITFKEEIKKLNKRKIYLIYRRSGRRSDLASRIFWEGKFSIIYNLFGGIIEWTKMGYPIEK